MGTGPVSDGCTRGIRTGPGSTGVTSGSGTDRGPEEHHGTHPDTGEASLRAVSDAPEQSVNAARVPQASSTVRWPRLTVGPRDLSSPTPV